MKAESGTLAYDAEFYRGQALGSLASARRAVPMVMEYVGPVRSVIDVGCGVATWASAFGEAGVEDVWGVDGDYVERAGLHIAPERFVARDLTKPLEMGRTFDLAVCLEVGEHLPEAHARTLVGSLAGLAPVVLFSAAVPHQGGTSHLNEQWPAYWAGHFKSFGFVAIDCLRQRLWRDAGVQWWYAQNMFFLVKKDRLAQYPALQQEFEAGGADPLPLVHPFRYQMLADVIEDNRASVRTVLRMLRAVLEKAIRGNGRA